MSDCIKTGAAVVEQKMRRQNVGAENFVAKFLSLIIQRARSLQEHPERLSEVCPSSG